ncbi:uncharacterized protein LOC133497573 isoform X2 [Syngnathoides biaculeatus]|uniref:uncharacterized protein LOC133497573 isoform X2 n=1 Tax=Syngnathoides biaculeatus TaxID=300417 RepID=UPI002ADDA852|nr:uncharacterized protein LOC133497573 isoform X2 [Syngnathoides biaculeatus]
MCARSLARYEEELCGTKAEDEQQPQVLDAVPRPPVVLHRTGDSEGDLRPEQQEPEPPFIKKEEPETPHFKEEEQEDEILKFPFTGVSVKNEDDGECDGDRWGGSQADGLFAPLSDSDDITSHSSDPDDDDAHAATHTAEVECVS